MTEELEDNIGVDETEVVKKEKVPEDAIEELKKQIESEKAARAAAEKKAQEAEANAQKSEEKALSAQDVALKNAEERLETALGSAESKLVDLQRQYKEAYESGDVDAVLKANDAILEAKLDLRQLKANKEGVEKYKEKMKQKPEASKTDGVSEPVKAWIKDHPEFETDEAFRASAIAAHHLAVKRGVKVDTPEYFAFVEKRLDLDKEEDAPTDTEPKKKDDRIRQGGAPPSRGPAVSKTTSGNGRYRTLTPAQKEAAEVCGMTEVEYAESLQRGE